MNLRFRIAVCSLACFTLIVSFGAAKAQAANSAVAASTATAKKPSIIQVVNIIPDFLNFWAEAQSKAPAEQVKLFRLRLIDRHPALFAANVAYFGPNKGNAAENAYIALYLSRIRPYIPAIRTLNTRLSVDLELYGKNFAVAFPDFRPTTPVYFTVSLGGFDGGTRMVAGGNALCFGIDVIAMIYGPKASLSVLFDHELFHLYHASLNLPASPADGELWQSLWEEGLAQYVSWRMNPTSDEDDVLLNPTLAERARPLQSTLVTDFLRDFHSQDMAVYGNYFYGNGVAAGIPARSGYFLGFEAVSRIGVSDTLEQLARMHGPELETRIEQTLKNMSNPAPAK